MSTASAPGPTDVVVVGAGAAGLATAALLGRKRIPYRVLERGTEIGESWSRRYDRLHLNTIRQLSRMPGLPIARRAGRWVARDDFVAYLRGYRAHHRIELEFGTSVERVDRAGDYWLVTTSRGTIEARHVVVATGFDCTPHLPPWPGLDSFSGPVLHSSDYRNAAAFRGREVLVVGAGSSGTEIALDLANGGAASVAIAIRTFPLLLAREWMRIPVSLFSMLAHLSTAAVRDFSARLLSRAMFGDLSSYGIGRSGQRLSEMIARGRLPTVDTGFVEAVHQRRIRVVAAVEGFDRSDVMLADGSRLSPDCVIAATAYRGGLDSMLGHLGIVGADGRPQLEGQCQNSSAPGLYFVGYRTALTGHLSPMRSDARRVARAIGREVRRTAAPSLDRQPAAGQVVVERSSGLRA